MKIYWKVYIFSEINRNKTKFQWIGKSFRNKQTYNKKYYAGYEEKTAVRNSELFGLAKDNDYYDLNFEEATFDVNKNRHYLSGKGKFTKYPKNDSSIRKKSLPQSILSYLDLYYKLLTNLNYKNMYIFDYLSIDGICSWFANWQEKNNIKKIRFHDIRHTHATILLYKGVDVKTISERLGHCDIQTTLDIYADVLKELDVMASNKIDEL